MTATRPTPSCMPTRQRCGWVPRLRPTARKRWPASSPGGAEAARLALVNGIPAAVWAPGGRPQVVFMFTISGAKITGIGLTADPDLLRDLDIVFLSSRGHRSAKGHVHHSP